MRDDETGCTGEPETCPAHGSRFAAGADPVKRGQILDGAQKVFMHMGFDAASMNDIVREAGVSKGTIYVYFENKEQLFAELIARERDRFADDMRQIVSRYDDVEEALNHYGNALVGHMCSVGTISAMRSVIAVADRMPGLTRNFFRCAPATIRSVLRDLIEREAANGRLIVEDTDLAARQFIDLTTGTYLKFRLFGELPEPPPEAEVIYSTNAAVRMFMACYGAPKP